MSTPHPLQLILIALGLIAVGYYFLAVYLSDRRSRTQTKKLLDAVESLLMRKNSDDDVASYSINGRSLVHYSFAELLAIRNRLRANCNR